jgi:hypothetical protein
MTQIFDDPADFAEEALDGLVAANRGYVARVDGGVVRSTEVPTGWRRRPTPAVACCSATATTPGM